MNTVKLALAVVLYVLFLLVGLAVTALVAFWHGPLAGLFVLTLLVTNFCNRPYREPSRRR